MIGFIKRLLTIKQNPFSKFKVIQQIFVIIGIMAFFALIQGVLSLGLINAINHNTYEAFIKNKTDSSIISVVKQDLQQLRNNYQDRLAGQLIHLTSPEILNRAVNHFKNLKGGQSKLVNLILTKLKDTGAILEAPVEASNYQKIDQNLLDLNDSLNMLDNTIRNEMEASIVNSATFAEKAKLSIEILLILSILVSIVLGWFVASSLSHPLQKMLALTESLASGDLTQNIEATGSMEINTMATGLNLAVNGLQGIVKVINEGSDNLFAACKELKEASFESGQSATQVAVAAEELAKASSEQTDQINKAVEIINFLSNLVKKVATEVDNLSITSEQVAQSAKLGQQAATDIASEVTVLFSSTNDVATVINDLNNTSQEISEITSVIGGIAEQTALLALNAAIEAARAGEHGKGFAVVAHETGKLAEQSKQATNLITNLIDQMKTRMEQAVKVIQKIIEKVANSKDLIIHTDQTFGEIFNTLIKNMDQISIVANSTKQMAESNDNVINAINNIAAISEENMASTEEVSATTEQQTAAVQEVTALAENLSQIAEELKEVVSIFKI